MLDDQIAAEESHLNFLKRVAASGEVWGLKNVDGWCVCDSNLNEPAQVMPFWSDRAYAAQCAKEGWADYQPTCIPLVKFIQAWLPGMAKDGILVGTNWNVHLIGAETKPLLLKSELENASNG